MIIDYGTNEPVEDVIISQTDHGVGIDWKWTPTGGRYEIGQTFRYDSGFLLDRITLFVDRADAGALNREFALSVYEMDGTVPVGDALVEEPGTWPYSGTTDYYVAFDVPNVSLEGETSYGFFLVWDAPVSDQLVRVYQIDENFYSGGTMLSSTDGSMWTDLCLASRDRDWQFYIQTPEPTTLAMLALGGVATLLRRRRR